MTLLADLLTTVFDRRDRFSWRSKPGDRPLPDLAAELVAAEGEVTGLTIAQQLLAGYREADDATRLAFFRFLAQEMTISPDAIRQALAAYEQGQSKASYRAYMEAAEPPRQELIRRLNRVPGATRTLVRMRMDLLRLGGDDDAIQALDLDFRHLFASWFNRGFLVLRPISWESPAHILEKIIAYEAVHAINSWDDLRDRLEPADRRCFAFFHPAMPDEPLIFVEVALTRGIPGTIHEVLTDQRPRLFPEDADTAVFYSISNCQQGLAGISFGNSLIKQVASDLAHDWPGLKTFVTLSPIPGLVRWLDTQGIAPLSGDGLREQAARYLLQARRPDGQPVDPVARFHLGNGARILHLHADADLSDKGLAQSAGAMVNYHYDFDTVTQNHEGYATRHQIAASSEIRGLAAAAEKADKAAQTARTARQPKSDKTPDDKTTA
ncbi:malonyl-CoA decarboxylase [Marinibacterium sp. SX1]|uniref:malonyl-CoA decarboxylase n=1 Tax=Marinibacterium sp. SX1 TaxID=3388424 RepID=UPI003D16B0F1